MKSIIIIAALVAISNALSTNDINTVKLLDDNGQLIKRSTTQTVNVLVVIDTEKLLDSYKNPSRNPDTPTGISHDHAFMIAPQKYVISGQATADLHVRMHVFDNIRFYGSTESGNSDSSIIVYKLVATNSNDIIDEPRLQNIRGAPCIFPKKNDIRTTLSYQCNYVQAQMTALSKGQVSYLVYFGLYTKTINNNGDNIVQLHGYYYWDPKITINN